MNTYTLFVKINLIIDNIKSDVENILKQKYNDFNFNTIKFIEVFKNNIEINNKIVCGCIYVFKTKKKLSLDLKKDIKFTKEIYINILFKKKKHNNFEKKVLLNTKIEEIFLKKINIIINKIEDNKFKFNKNNFEILELKEINKPRHIDLSIQKHIQSRDNKLYNQIYLNNI